MRPKPRLEKQLRRTPKHNTSLMEGRSLLDSIFGLRRDLQDYLEKKVSYYGLTAFEKAVRLLTTFLGNGVIVMTMLISVIFLAGAAAFYLGTLLESNELGMLIVGGFFLLITLVLMLFRNKLFSPYIIRSLSDVFFRDDDDNQ